MPTRCRRFLAALALLAPWLTAGGAAHGQQLFDISPFQFNLSTPGARSLGMGGTFLALADDATAAYTNPAGLTNLTVGGPEVALEVRQWRFSNVFRDSGHVCDQETCPLTGVGVDTVEGVELGESTNDANGLSFLSVGIVLRRGITLAFYRHELANFRSEFETQGLLIGDIHLDCSATGSCRLECRSALCARLPAVRSGTDLDIVNFGVSGAYELDLPLRGGRESKLSIGLGISYYQLDLTSREEAFGFVELPRDTILLNELEGLDRDDLRLPGHLFGPPDFLGDLHAQTLTQRGDDGAWGFNLGWLWKLGNAQRWRLGGVYRWGPFFEIDVLDGADPVARTAFTVPDVYGLGVAFSTSGGKTKVAFDVNRVRYSQRLGDFIGVISSLLSLAPDLSLENFRVEDADELHLGFEHVFLTVESLFVATARLGVWHDPFHELELVGVEAFPSFVAELGRPSTGDVTHFSVGLGLVIKEDYQVDVAADFSDRGDTFSFSLVKFF